MRPQSEWPAAKVHIWPLEKIIPYPHNPRTHPPEQIKLLAQSMRDGGVTTPILVDEEGVIIAGHGRRLAALENGFTKYPVAVARGWSETQKRAERLKDNQLGLMSEWDRTLLSGEIGQLKLEGYDLPLLGFGDVELVQFETTPMPPITSEQANASLAERFGVVPFSVLNARAGWWQDRKRAWLALGIQSELGRGENLLKFSETVLEPNASKRKAKNGAKA